jgi:hypothetical protein
MRSKGGRRCSRRLRHRSAGPDLPGFEDALEDADEIEIDLTGDNDITTGDDNDLIVTGLGDDTIDAVDGDNYVYADSIPSDSIGKAVEQGWLSMNGRATRIRWVVRGSGSGA